MTEDGNETLTGGQGEFYCQMSGVCKNMIRREEREVVYLPATATPSIAAMAFVASSARANSTKANPRWR